MRSFKIYTVAFCFLSPDSYTDTLSAMLLKADFNKSAGFSVDVIGVSNPDGGLMRVRGGEGCTGQGGVEQQPKTLR